LQLYYKKGNIFATDFKPVLYAGCIK
jgi:hypothetical protein